MKKLPILLSLSLLTSALASTEVKAVDGCLALLCFAAPVVGAEEDCKATVRQVLKDLAKGRGFPVCHGVNGAIDPNNEARLVNNAPLWDDCPEGTKEVKAGTLIKNKYGRFVESGLPARMVYARWQPATPKACVVFNTKGGYENIIWLEPQTRRAVEVYIDGKFYNRTRY